MTTLVFYGDETGTHTGGNGGASKITALAGYIAPLEDWQRFEIEWKAFLASYTVTRIHAIDIEQSKNSFRNWRAVVKQQFLADGLAVIGRHALAGMSCHFNNVDYDRIYKAGRSPKKLRLFSRYGVAAGGMFAALSSLVDHPSFHVDEINVILASGGAGAGDAIHAFEWIRNDPEPSTKKLSSLTFTSDTGLAGIQVADLFAYAAYQHLKNRSIIARFGTMWDQYLGSEKVRHHYAFMGAKMIRTMKSETLRLDELRMNFRSSSSAVP